MERVSRFGCPSMGLDIGALLHRTRNGLAVALAAAAVLHLALTFVRGIRAEERSAKPLTTWFVKRSPRLTKPLELKKRPRPKRRSMRREMVSVQPRVGRAQASCAFQPAQVLRSLAAPVAQMKRVLPFRQASLEPGVVAEQIQGAREPKAKLSMALEMVDVDALDTGEYQALIIQDPVDRRNIRGFFHIAVAYPTSITNQQMDEINTRVVPALSALAEAMNRYTGIRTDLRGRFPFNSRQMFSTPWVYIRFGIERGATTDGELEVLGEHALSGGFVFVDGHGGRTPHYAEYETYQWMIVRCLELNGLQRGRHWEFDQTFSDHPLYHCFFDFEGLPAGGYGETMQARGGILPQVPYLHTVSIDGRMIIVFCHKAYFVSWGEWPTLYQWDNTRQLQFGVNLLVFALTQEGSITNRVMDIVGGY